MQLTKQQFVTIMDIISNLLKEQRETENTISKIFDECHSPLIKLGNKTLTQLVDFLQANTIPNGDDINWFIWDCDMGKSKNNKWSFVDKSGKEKTFVCKTPSKFYDSLVYWTKMKGNV